uniref:Uncharacterized protein n=1 Tax=Arundo donax TaxID=35708 RepID=A0A0A8Z5H8_ARUDO
MNLTEIACTQGSILVLLWTLFFSTTEMSCSPTVSRALHCQKLGTLLEHEI